MRAAWRTLLLYKRLFITCTLRTVMNKMIFHTRQHWSGVKQPNYLAPTRRLPSIAGDNGSASCSFHAGLPVQSATRPPSRRPAAVLFVFDQRECSGVSLEYRQDSICCTDRESSKKVPGVARQTRGGDAKSHISNCAMMIFAIRVTGNTEA